MINKSTELSGAGSYPSRKLNQRERKVLETAESYTPGEEDDWDTPPTTQDEAIDELAARATATEDVVADAEAAQAAAEAAQAAAETAASEAEGFAEDAEAAATAGADHSTDGLGKIAKMAIATYDFAQDGGVQGDIGLGVTLPDNAILVGLVTDVVTAPTSATDTGTLTFTLATDGAIGTTSITADGAATSTADYNGAKKLTGAREIRATIATEDLTAGVVRAMVLYVEGL